MKYLPSYTLPWIEDGEFHRRIGEICQRLDACRVSGALSGVDGARLFYEYFPVEKARGAVVLLHGMSEFTQKHYELSYYLMEQGYSVYLYDHRCHGRSQRLTDHRDLIHVERFSNYVEDLDIFVRTVVQPTAGTPLYLYGHSMGGAVSLFYLAKHRDVFRRAILSAPLFQPRLPVALPLATASAWWDTLTRGPKSKLSHSKEFVAKMPPEWEQDPKCSRNRYMMQLRLDDPDYRTTPMSARFALRALYLTPRLMRLAKKIQTPMLMVCGQADTVVESGPQQRFARRCPMCSYVSVPEGRHSMMCDCKEQVTIHTHLVLDFLREDEA